MLSLARLRHRAAAAGAVPAVLLLAACGANVEQPAVDEAVPAPQNYLEPVGRYAVNVDQLWDIVLWIAIAIFFLVQILIVVAVLRYRERPGDDRLPKQVHGNPRLEAMWTIIPAAILAAVAVPTVRAIFELAEEPADALIIDVIGHQWWWEFQYPAFDNLVTANIMHIPTGQEVLLRMTSEDVIHSFWVPKLAGKQDVVPGRTTSVKLFVDEPGEYLGQCAEYCGLSHANMRQRVVALPPAEFADWARTHATPQTNEPEPGSLAAQGKELFVTKGCAGCHSIRGFPEASAAVGPDLTYFADRDWFAGAIFRNDVLSDNPETVAAWLADPPAMKPMKPENPLATQGMPDLGLTDDEIAALIAYLRTLRPIE